MHGKGENFRCRNPSVRSNKHNLKRAIYRITLDQKFTFLIDSDKTKTLKFISIIFEAQ